MSKNQCLYWVGQKGLLSFSIRYNRKIQMNFLANPTLYNKLKNCNSENYKKKSIPQLKFITNVDFH